MMFARSLLIWVCLFHRSSTYSLSATTELSEIVPTKTLMWYPCNEAFSCARLDVPLDYQDHDLGRAAVALVKYPAQANSSSGPYQGMILLNPGGPGSSGVEEVLEYGPTLQAIIGSNWDFVGFDPRGIYASHPLANCSTLTNPSTPRSVPRLSDQYYTSFIEFGADLGSQCAATIGSPLNAGPHMSTATTARDMLSIVDAFAATSQGQTAAKPAHLLNYYGISYGTFLGQTFASMFPERVGNVVLDGNVQPEAYLTNFTSASVLHLDGVIAAFFIYCHEAGPELCAFDQGTSARESYDRFARTFVQLDPRKAEVNGWTNATDIEAALLVLKVGLLTTAVTPLDYFSVLPDVLLALEAAVLAQDVGPWTANASLVYGDPSVATYRGSEPQWTLGILCSDQGNRWYNKTLEDLQPLLEELDSQSIVGEVWIHAMLACTGWSVEATEVYSGPFGGDTTTPILFVGNTYDPVTPVENAISSAVRYNNAQVLVVDGMGHTTRTTGNTCAFAKITEYFQTGQMPGSDNFCAMEIGPFGITLAVNGTLEQSIMEAGLSQLVH